MNWLWDELCTEAALKRGWHLTQSDAQQDIVEEPFSRETFAFFLEDNIRELRRTLRAGDYRPHPLTRIAIPKGNLGTRPGTLLSLEDRVVLFAALKLIAEPIDKTLIDEVYSYRVKSSDNRKSLFHESDVLSLPFLKNSTVKKYIDPFDPWYGLWPKFDSLSREAFQSDGYQFMATSDIAAYYENIQLDILRDQLNGYLHQEPKIVNLFYTAFSAWTYDTNQGRRYLRGIPQGSQITAFFGNIFLKPIDDAFVALRQSHDIKYFRYMDDIRIFTKTFGDARKAIMVLDAEIRRLHLNLQSAKTRIYSENEGEISAALIDRRIAQAETVGDEISRRDKDARKSKIAPDYSGLSTMLDRIADANPDAPDEQRIRHARKPLKGLSDRVFRRLLTLHIRIGSDEIIDRLLTEITRNSDYRLGLKLIQFARHFPRKLSIQTRAC
jgi:hypothetical protein